jgi:signal transduction histidine kinase
VPHSAASTVTAIYLDSRKRLWVAWSTNGLNRIDHPEAEKPGIARITTANGLSSNEIWCLTEDRFGRIYAGTGHGVDRIEPDSQGTGIRVRHYTQADGLARGNIQAAYRTRSGDLWFLTNFGASRLTPRPEIGNPPPSVVLTQLRIEGAEQAVSQFGEQAIRNLRLSPAERYIELEFAGIDAGFDPGLTYEYRLKEMEPAWRPTTQRLVQYGGLSPGVYEFRVRAVNQQGSASPVPASLSFEILAPVWRRWWALVLEVVALGSLLYAAHRRRIRYVLELERVRTRIARDLHDDIGSSLTQIAILSEVARAGSSADGHLSHIARLSRELIDSMSEIVWAINPERDRLSDLTQRMRRFAADLLTERAIELDFRAPAGDLKLDAATRRELFLVFKEAVTNVSSHSGCTGAEVELTVGRHTLTLRVADNGSGTAPDENAGNGLANMRRRAAALGGFLTITPTDPGTTVWLEIPLDGGTRLRKQVGRKSGFRSLLKRRP